MAGNVLELDRLSRALRTIDSVLDFHRRGAAGEIQTTLRDFSVAIGTRVRWALVGGLALGAHLSQPRATQDVDVLMASETDLETIAGLTQAKFRRVRPHALAHRETGVVVELLTPQFLRQDEAISTSALSSAQTVNGVPVAGKEALIATKLQRASLQDRADIERLLRAHGALDLSAYPLTTQQQALYEEILVRSRQPTLEDRDK